MTRNPFKIAMLTEPFFFSYGKTTRVVPRTFRPLDEGFFIFEQSTGGKIEWKRKIMGKH